VFVNRNNLLSPKISALLFSCTLLYVHAMLPELGPNLDLAGTIASGISVVFAANAAGLLVGGNLVNDLRAQVLLDTAPWCLSSVVLGLVFEGSSLTSEVSSVAVAEAGFWTLLSVFSVKILYHRQKHRAGGSTSGVS
jgi:hypothetical protein